MSEEAQTTNYLIERFTMGPDVSLDGIALWLGQVAANGFELVTAYGVQHPTTSAIIHHFVVQRRVGGVAMPELSAEERELQLAELAGGGKTPAATPRQTSGKARR
ncbi:MULTISPECIES: hypothetical protein [unclassified Bradyrhizobium]|uniref:hypothetical protein n=1 Tax=unclassified Bradyrhizobium TaxID=2631580 RepID=UPI0028E244D5|nr:MULTISPECIES: hypothetical protein [unclassified Bradyrhizobium]